MGTGILTIDLDAIVANWRAIDAMTDVETAAVVKANAYGLGIGPVAKALAHAGARKFFVAAAEEGAELRQTLGDGPRIFVFSGHMSGDASLIDTAQLIPLLNSPEQLMRHAQSLSGRPYGIQLDSGMNRLGIEPEDWAQLQLDLPARPELIMSHLACADDPRHDMNAQQLAAFQEMTASGNAALSLAATGGALLGSDYHFDLTRPGVGLYGGLPFAGARPVVKLSLPVVQTRFVEQGESVGYGNAWVARRKTQVATVAAGYADGLIRAMSDRAMLYAGDVPCPLIGRVSMDLITVDVTDLGEAPETLDILNDTQTVDKLADAAGTIGYEILTSLGARYARRYKGGT